LPGGADRTKGERAGHERDEWRRWRIELPQRVLLRADEQGRFVALGNRVNLTRLLEMECQRASREDAPG